MEPMPFPCCTCKCPVTTASFYPPSFRPASPLLPGAPPISETLEFVSPVCKHILTATLNALLDTNGSRFAGGKPAQYPRPCHLHCGMETLRGQQGSPPQHSNKSRSSPASHSETCNVNVTPPPVSRCQPSVAYWRFAPRRSVTCQPN